MLPLALGLGAAACIGVGDFLAGIASRRLPPVLVGFWAQGAALVLAALLVALFRPPLIPGQLTWGFAAGVVSGVGIALLYRGMAVGAISLVAPITACSVALPVVYSVAAGESLTPLETGGVAAIVAGVVLASLPRQTAEPAARHDTAAERRAVALAIGAALGFGLFFVIIDLAPHAGGWGSLWTAAAVRVAAFGVQAGLVLLGPVPLARPGSLTGPVVAAGLLDQLSLLLIALGTLTSAYGIVTALIGLYPIATALLGVFLLRERLSHVQSAGAALAMAGVLFVSV